MSWRQEAMKDVGTCDKPREAGNQAVILGFLNGETRLVFGRVIGGSMHRPSRRTQGTETSKYLKEQKETSIPSVAASEIGIAQTGPRAGVVDTNMAIGTNRESSGKSNQRR